MPKKVSKKTKLELAKLHLEFYVAASTFLFFAATFILAVFGIVTSIDAQVWTTDLPTRNFTMIITFGLTVMIGLPYLRSLWKLRRNCLELLVK